eukprot:1143664-Pelagomonas_calceolata.AAC.5
MSSSSRLVVAFENFELFENLDFFKLFANFKLPVRRTLGPVPKRGSWGKGGKGAGGKGVVGGNCLPPTFTPPSLLQANVRLNSASNLELYRTEVFLCANTPWSSASLLFLLKWEWPMLTCPVVLQCSADEPGGHLQQHTHTRHTAHTHTQHTCKSASRLRPSAHALAIRQRSSNLVASAVHKARGAAVALQRRGATAAHGTAEIAAAVRRAATASAVAVRQQGFQGKLKQALQGGMLPSLVQTSPGTAGLYVALTVTDADFQGVEAHTAGWHATITNADFQGQVEASTAGWHATIAGGGLYWALQGCMSSSQVQTQGWVGAGTAGHHAPISPQE